MTNQERYEEDLKVIPKVEVSLTSLTGLMPALEGMDILGIYADMSKCRTD